MEINTNLNIRVTKNDDLVTKPIVQIDSEKIKGSSLSFGHALESVTTASSNSQTITAQNESSAFTSFIDNIDFSKFKSDPLNFGKFIPIAIEVTPLAGGAISPVVDPESAKLPDTSLDKLLGSIESQLSYMAPKAVTFEPSTSTSTSTSTSSSPVPVLAIPDKPLAVSPLAVEDVPEVESPNQVAANLATTYLANANISKAYNAADMLEEALTEHEPNTEK